MDSKRHKLLKGIRPTEAGDNPEIHPPSAQAEGVMAPIGRPFQEEEIPLGRPVQVVRTMEAFAFCGGWGDGPVTLHPGSKLYLERQVGCEVFFSAGSKPDPQLGGKFDASDLDALQDL